MITEIEKNDQTLEKRFNLDEVNFVDLDKPTSESEEEEEDYGEEGEDEVEEFDDLG